MNKYFLVQIKQTNGTIEKGVVVKDTLNAAKKSFHAFLGAYGYGMVAEIDYVCVAILDGAGNMVDFCVDDRHTTEEQTNE